VPASNNDCISDEVSGVIQIQTTGVRVVCLIGTSEVALYAVSTVYTGYQWSRVTCHPFVAFYFHIYGSRNEVSPPVFEKFRFYMELIRIYSVFHSVFNLHKICLKIDMLKNIPITKYAC